MIYIKTILFVPSIARRLQSRLILHDLPNSEEYYLCLMNKNLNMSLLRIIEDQDAIRGQRPIVVPIVEPLTESTQANTLIHTQNSLVENLIV